MSNWERRPLRLSQQHYAAMDAYILVEIIQKLAEKGQQDGGRLFRDSYSLLISGNTTPVNQTMKMKSTTIRTMRRLDKSPLAQNKP